MLGRAGRRLGLLALLPRACVERKNTARWTRWRPAGRPRRL